MEPWIETYTQKRFNIFNFTRDDISLLDIAHSLALQCRYNGHCKKFYSVAEHSCLMSSYVYVIHGRPAGLYALLHDASEAYLCDLPRPIKPHLKEYYQIESRIQEAIEQKYVGKIPNAVRAYIKVLDSRILLDEKAVLMGNNIPWNLPGQPLNVEIKNWDWRKAEMEFLKQFGLLMAPGGAK